GSEGYRNERSTGDPTGLSWIIMETTSVSSRSRPDSVSDVNPESMNLDGASTAKLQG
ncbi:unnamed protein product, partial [Amoebophrya sp. A120]